jgi:hypothetical protein
MDHRDQGRFEGERNKEGEQCRRRKKEDKKEGLVEFHLLIKIEPTHDLRSVYPVAYMFLTKSRILHQTNTQSWQSCSPRPGTFIILLLLEFLALLVKEGAMAPILLSY